MIENLTLLYHKECNIIYPMVILVGRGKDLHMDARFFTIADVEFADGSVRVITIQFDEIEKVDIKIFEGIPEDADNGPDIALASGMIEVGSDGLSIEHEIISWPEGLTHVMVALKFSEIAKKEVRTITFYVKHFKDKKKNFFSRIFKRDKEN